MERLPEEPVDANAISSMSADELLALVKELPDGYRMAFNLFAIEGYGHAEIAEMMGCGESTSRSQLAKARKWLQARVIEMEKVAL